jgi:hypothetical protein
MPPDLPATYYLDNVRTLFRHVESVYSDILDSDCLQFLSDFDQLGDDAQKLLVRLLNRTSTLFRQSKLNYSEIESVPAAVGELQSRGFVEIKPPQEPEQILPLFNKAELLHHHHDAASLKTLKRSELDNYLFEQSDAEFFKNLHRSECFISITRQDIYQMLQMIFFGNLNQSMTDFVLRDLGLYQYENYRIDFDNRPYRKSVDIQIHWLVHQLETYLQLIEPDDTDMLLDCFQAIPDCPPQQSTLFRKSERLRFKIARQLERIGKLDPAMTLYQQCRLPPARERQARIHHQQKNIEAALAICREIIDGPIDDAELQFAAGFASRLSRQHKLTPIAGIESRQKYEPEIIYLELAKNPSVEHAVVEYYQQQQAGQECFYLENSLFNSVLGLVIWDAIYAPVAGAFYNPFQYRPSDFYDYDFVEKRLASFEQIWSSIKNNNDIKCRVRECWEHKQGIANPLVDWYRINPELIDLALKRIPYKHWMKIFERQLRDLRNNRSGFPDLVVFPPGDGYLLVEVKGPGDTLQKNQQRWMQYFGENDIPHLLARVSWQAED